LFFNVYPVLQLTVAAAEINVNESSPQRTRGYFSLRYGRAFLSDNNIAPGFAIADGTGQGLFAAQLGFNWGRYFGLELAADYYQPDIDAVGHGKVIEYAIYDIIPQVRLRYPLLNDRLTPYVIGGIGVGFTEANDRTLLGADPALPHFDGQDTSVVYALGGGLEYFIADNIAIGVEAKYVFHNANVEVNGAPVAADLDAFLTSVGLRLLFPGPPKLAPAWVPPISELRPYFGFWLGKAYVLDKQITPGFEIPSIRRENVHAGAVGLDLNRYLGAEVAVNHYSRDINETTLGKVTEYDIWSFVPQVRVRYPLMGDRLVPYLTGGIGVGLTQTNDTTPLGASGKVPRFSADDYSVVGSVGAGLEYFVAYNMADRSRLGPCFHRYAHLFPVG
jgi:opacity protein-like surface antigen